MFDEGGGRAFPVAMLSRSQEKLLRYLGGFPDALAQAWDVPRDVSLPGLSDAMGVVRSGLNQPLNVLLDQKYITVRVAHVIGGGTRRRQVYHITEEGRAWLHDHPESIVEEQPSFPVEERVQHPLIGRTQELEELTNLVEEHGHALVGGLSGVGKTTLLRAWSGNQRDVVRWATVDELSDGKAIARHWMEGAGPLPGDLHAMVEHVNAAGGVLVVDDVHRLSERHQDAVVHLLGALRDRGHRVVLAGRLPVPAPFDWPLLRLGTLPTKDAIQLLGDHLGDDQRRDVAKALDGHPMALNLYREGDPLPEAGADIQAFVEQTMLMDLSEDAMDALDDMVLFPRPLPSADILGSESLGELDERALLRWSAGNTEVEVQHLIRNVRRTMLDEERLGVLHRRAVEHWSERSDNPAFAVLHLYHQLALEDESIEDILEERFEELMVDQSGAMAVIFDRATQRRAEDEGLHYWAGRIALHRQELSRVRTHLEAVEHDGRRHELAYGLAVLEGDLEGAERILNEQLDHGSTEEGARWLLKAAVALLEDRLFDQSEVPNTANVQRLLHRIQLPDRPTIRSSITVSMSLVQHTMALLEQDQDRAEALVDGLESLSHGDDPLVLHARLKAMVAFGASSDAISKAYERTLAAQPTPFHRAVVGLTLVEHLVRQGDRNAPTVFGGLPLPDAWHEMGAPHHRYAARWWYLKGHLDPSSAASALREASRCFRQAGCTNASKAAARRLHRVL
ncbi:MAG: hypothetical protein ACPHF0_01910 [Poseidonia sp.]